MENFASSGEWLHFLSDLLSWYVRFSFGTFQADLSFSSGGVSGSFARPSRQITKSGQSLFQNFPPTNSNGSMMGGFSNFGGNSSGKSCFYARWKVYS